MCYSKTNFLLALMAIHCGEKIKELCFIILSGRFLNKLPLPSKGNTKRLFVALTILIVLILFSWLFRGKKYNLLDLRDNKINIFNVL